MPSLDLRSIVLLAGFMGALMTMVLFALRRTFPPSIRGIEHWTGGAALLFSAAALIGTRGLIPDFLSIFVANLCLVGGSGLLLMGNEHFFDLPHSGRWIGGLFAALVPLLLWLTYVSPNYGLRVASISGPMAVIFLLNARLVLLYGLPSFPYRFAAVALTVQGCILTLRFVMAWWLPAEDHVFAPNPVQSLYVAVYILAMLVLSIGLVLMATDRLRGELEYLATHDTLTAVLNRRALIEAAEEELARCRRNGQTMAVLVIDLDHFKRINDEHGHLAGDRVLRSFAQRAGDALRRPDRIGRYGGEEFVVLLPETGREAALVVAERIRDRLREPHGLPPFTVSIGVATSRAEETDFDSLLHRADQAMYQAKARGRNRVEAEEGGA